ncbi:DUF6343 family protein [Streptomyces fulvorobeus]|uniref:NhaP-type Na+/H+ or K+/H+ antiporter n=1 Tax=Streptomyces fulvorobeus TaxID=284028 RepID=A0A7J0C3E2_9ACTN|nr:NhaP-type Na+/H+ or K+/H+ antiporter [Streptomyces fulvorobeus]GFM96463.1 hypothetical protein Sfulv_12740 [Streptomyces fulvorobeus]
MRMRTGSEPVTARSPLRLRLVLALCGLTWAVFGLIAFSLTGRPGWAAACGALVVLALTDAAVVVRRIRQGPRYQPGRDVPPYEAGQDGRDGFGR